MDKNALFRFLLVLLTLSCVVFVAAVPAIIMRLRNSEEEMKEGIVESRMLMDIVDYPGTRPNPAHDPKSPGKP
ncbi:hypothetical protein JHK84_053225 [Glycine max]|nr:hypothetical protein JHK86_053197 [Glycine max]KAG5083187.1 hypothetical protein JHK84_053225 [Glycine max]